MSLSNLNICFIPLIYRSILSRLRPIDAIAGRCTSYVPASYLMIKKSAPPLAEAWWETTGRLIQLEPRRWRILLLGLLKSHPQNSLCFHDLNSSNFFSWISEKWVKNLGTYSAKWNCKENEENVHGVHNLNTKIRSSHVPPRKEVAIEMKTCLESDIKQKHGARQSRWSYKCSVHAIPNEKISSNASSSAQTGRVLITETHMLEMDNNIDPRKSILKFSKESIYIAYATCRGGTRRLGKPRTLHAERQLKMKTGRGLKVFRGSRRMWETDNYCDLKPH